VLVKDLKVLSYATITEYIKEGVKMQKLRQKKINDFINTLNEREQEYLKNQIIKKINERDSLNLDFVVKYSNGKKIRIIA